MIKSTLARNMYEFYLEYKLFKLYKLGCAFGMFLGLVELEQLSTQKLWGTKEGWVFRNTALQYWLVKKVPLLEFYLLEE